MLIFLTTITDCWINPPDWRTLKRNKWVWGARRETSSAHDRAEFPLHITGVAQVLLTECRPMNDTEVVSSAGAFVPERSQPVYAAGAVDRQVGAPFPQGQGFQTVGPPVPFIPEGKIPDIRLIRDSRENLYLGFIIAFNVLVFAAIATALVIKPQITLVVLSVLAQFGVLAWIAWKLAYAMFFGHSIRIGPNQYPHLHRLFCAAAQQLGVHEPVVLVLHGQGMVELFLAKRFTRRGVIILTSNLFETLKGRPTSRELMMAIGIQLGRIMAGHYRFWLFKDVIGSFAVGFHAAWKRHCILTADRIGLLVAGDIYAAEQGLLALTVGDVLASGTNVDDVREQREELFDDIWSWIRLPFEHYPYMVDRLVRLREFAHVLESAHALMQSRVGALRLQHQPVRSVPVFIIHGHDRMALLELKNFLFTKFPNVMPLVLVEETLAAATIPEKLEAVADQVYGAIALITPDDTVSASSSSSTQVSNRARQNVVLEIGWFWARLGRHRCLLLSKGKVDLPSDLAGAEWHQFMSTPTECSESIRDFLSRFDPVTSTGARNMEGFASLSAPRPVIQPIAGP